MFKFESKVAWRHLINGGLQTLLTIGAVALGAFLVIFMSSLIGGLQQNLIKNIVGSLPNITIRAPDYVPRAPWELDEPVRGDEPVVTRREQATQRITNVSNWQELAAGVESIDGVVAVSPIAQGGGFASSGARNEPIIIIGVIPERQLATIRLEPRVISGNFAELDSEGVFIGIALAEDLGVSPGDRIRITSNEGNTRIFIVRGLFDLGFQAANETWVYMQLRPAQGLLMLSQDVTEVYIKVDNIFESDNIANQIRTITPLEVESWTAQNPSFLQALQSQNATSYAIQFIAVLASAFAVSSVLIVFVVQKSRDIGILKSMGASGKQILRIFTFEGIVIGVAGAIIGSIFSSAIAIAIQSIIIPGREFAGEPTTFIPMLWRFRYVVIAFVVSLVVGFLSSLFPARRAAALNPVEVIRGG